jgi:lipopolysaccharide export system permease protein
VPKTLYKYIGNEIWPTFVASLFVSVFIVLATKMVPITELIVSRGVKASQVFWMLVFLLPDIVAFALPAATLIAVVVAFLRLSADSEIIALEASGVSLYQMLPPVVVLSFLGLLLAGFISMAAVPWGNRSFKSLLFQIAQSQAHLRVEEHIFSEPFDDVVFFVNSFSSKENLMRDVFVVDKRDPAVTNTIVAEEARILMHAKERSITLHFSRGTIFVAEKDLKSSKTIAFNTYDLSIGLKDILAALESREKDPKEMSMGELIRHLKMGSMKETKKNEMLIELLEKFSIPLAVFLMGLIGAPLGAQLRTRGRPTGIGISLMVFLVYYVCLAGMKSICETGFLSPSVGVWIPDLFLFFCCVYLLRMAAKERSFALLGAAFFVQDFALSRLGMLKRGLNRFPALKWGRRISGSPQQWEQLLLPLDLKDNGEVDGFAKKKPYVGNVRMHKFHKSECKWAQRITPDNYSSFEAREEALGQGYSPCKVCKP